MCIGAARTIFVGMTNPANFPAPMYVPEAAHPKPARSAREAWKVVDAIVSSLLVVGVAVMNCFGGFVLFMGWAMSSEGCTSGSACHAQDDARAVIGFAAVGLLLSVVVAIGGLLVSARKNIVMIWAPVAGLMIAIVTWAIVFTA